MLFLFVHCASVGHRCAMLVQIESGLLECCVIILALPANFDAGDAVRISIRLCSPAWSRFPCAYSVLILLAGHQYRDAMTPRDGEARSLAGCRC